MSETEAPLRAGAFLAGTPQPGVNVDRLDIEAGLRFAAERGYESGHQQMLIHYGLQRWARGEEESAAYFDPIFRDDVYAPEDEVLGVLITWFANAIETGRDAGAASERERIMGILTPCGQCGLERLPRYADDTCTAGLPTDLLECPKHPGQYGDH